MNRNRPSLRCGMLLATLMLTTLKAVAAPSPDYALTFSRGAVEPVSSPEARSAISRLKSLMSASAEQGHWRFVLTGYLPADCSRNGCPESELLRQRIEHLAMLLIGSRHQEIRLSWRSADSVLPDVIEVHLNADAEPPVEVGCPATAWIEDPHFPPAQGSSESGYLVQWRTVVPASTHSRLRLRSQTSGWALVKPRSGDARRIEVTEQLEIPIEFGSRDLPATIELELASPRRALGDLLRPWDAPEGDHETAKESPCTVRVDAWEKG